MQRRSAKPSRRCRRILIRFPPAPRRLPGPRRVPRPGPNVGTNGQVEGHTSPLSVLPRMREIPRRRSPRGLQHRTGFCPVLMTAQRPLTPPGLWHEVGRSAAGPVHWPLCPAPLPPFVGGLGAATAGATPPTVAAAASSAAMIGRRRERFIIETTSIRSCVLPCVPSVDRLSCGSRHDAVAEINHKHAGENEENLCRSSGRI